VRHESSLNVTPSAYGRPMPPHRSHKRKSDDPVDYFWSRTDRSGDCWTWTGSTLRGGYGFAWFEHRGWQSHRLAWTLTNGAIPDGMVVRHRCDNPPCCNPSHLELGSHNDNVADAVERGRTKLGRGRGTVRERRPGVFEVQVMAGKDPLTGRYRMRSRTAKGADEVERVRRELLEEVAARFR
jgi:hypothetical protein